MLCRLTEHLPQQCRSLSPLPEPRHRGKPSQMQKSASTQAVLSTHLGCPRTPTYVQALLYHEATFSRHNLVKCANVFIATVSAHCSANSFCSTSCHQE